MKQKLPVLSSLRFRIVLLTIGFSLLAASSVLWLNEVKAKELAETRAEEQLASEVQKIALKLEGALETVAADARLAASTPPIQGIIRSERNNGIDPLDGSTNEIWRRRLESIFSSMMRVRGDYDQLRFIGFEDDGRELVRVDRVGSDISIVPPVRLQAKGDEPYMVAGKSLQPGRTTVFPVSLNREFGKVDVSKAPIIRVVVPVADEIGEPYGIVVININAEVFLNGIVREARPPHTTYIIDNYSNFYLYNPKRRSGEFVLSETLDPENIEFVRQLSGGEHSEGDFVAPYPLVNTGLAQGLKLDAVVTSPRLPMMSAFSTSLSDGAAFVLLMLGIGTGLVAFFATRMTEPLREMTESISRYRASGHEQRLDLPNQSGGEIGNLSKAFSDLVKQLEDSRTRTNDIVRHSVDGLIVINREGTVETFNPACERMFGYQAHEVIGKNVTALISENDAAWSDERQNAGQFSVESGAVGTSREVCGRKKSGEEFPLELTIGEFRQNGKVYFSGSLRDLSERKRHEREIERQKNTLELALDTGQLGFWLWHLPTGKVDFCDRSASLVGLTRDQMSSDHSNWNNLVDPEQRDRVAQAMAAFIKNNCDVFEQEFRMKHKDGHWVWVLSRAVVSERDTEGRIVQITGVQQDITDRKRKELQIEDRNRRLEMAETVANMGHWSLTASTGEMRWSKGIFEIHGLDPEDGLPPLEEAIEFYHEEDRQLVSDYVDAAINHGTPFEFQLRLVRKTGEIRHVVSRGEPISLDGDPERTIVFGVIQDVTEKVRSEMKLKASENKNRSLLETIVDGVCTIDTAGIIDNCNPAMARMFGYTVDELIGSHVSRLIPAHARDLLAKSHQALVKSSSSSLLGQTLQHEGLRKNGEVFTLEVAISELQLDGRKLFTGVMRDITERKQMETMKDEFVSTVNHELRTPLTSIFGSLDLLRHMSAGKLDEKGDRLLRLAHDGCGRLTSLVNDILDIEKIAAGKMDYRFETVHLTDVVDDIITRHEGLAERYKVRFDVQHEIDDVQVNLDPSRFNQAVVNLLSNAAKFSPEGAAVTILTQRLENGRIRISVSDRGPGIPAAFRSRIFERFAQADGSSTRKNTAGSGLGLNITKSIIEAFGGTVGFETEEGKGTTFYFDLPIADIVPQAIAS
tara:strand:- start:8128 stop:11559 length:3432 start_codon:yes stop_codon:yes gene_type:complete